MTIKEVKLDQVDLHNAQVWFDNLKKQLSLNTQWDPMSLTITQQGLEDIATLLHNKKVGRWDDLMNDLQTQALQSENNKINDIANLIAAWRVRTNEAAEYKQPPSDLHVQKTLYQLVSQILKVLRVDMSADNGNSNINMEHTDINS